MKKKRGITLVEVIISVGLIALVMLFLFSLLSDMQYEENHPSFSKTNHRNRSLIIKAVQEDFLKYHLQIDKVTMSKSEDTVTIRFFFEDISEERPLIVTKNSISYQGEKWLLDDSSENVFYEPLKVDMKKSTDTEICDANRQNCSDFASLKISIPVSTSAKENSLDDIELFYIGRKS